MSDSVNPYAAPLTDSFPQPRGLDPADTIPRRLEFRGELTRQHHCDAVVKAGIRRDYRRAWKIVLLMVVMYFFVVLLPIVTARDSDSAIVIRAIASTSLFGFGVGSFFLYQLRALSIRLPNYQLATGPIKGWIDRDELSIQSDRYSALCPMAMLVSAASTHDIAVLSFSKDQTYWHTIPIDAFDDPALARTVFSDLQRIRPPALAQFGDERKRTVPDQPFRFVPEGDAIRFAGKIHQDSNKGTRFETASRRMTRGMWMMMAVFLGSIFASVTINFRFGPALATLTLLWFLLVAAMVYFRIWKARRKAKQAGRVVTHYAKGWLDEQAYCAMTALGQSRMTWDFFDHHEITDRAIALYPFIDDACCCLIAREQFPDEKDWDRATKLVHKKVA